MTDQAAYPPSHYLRRVPEKIVHYFTITQIIQLTLLVFVAFFTSPSVELGFPILLFLLLPFRSYVIPKMFQSDHLNALDSHS